MANISTWNLSSANSNQTNRRPQTMCGESRKLADEIFFVFHCIAVASAIPLTLCNVVVFLQKNMRSATAVYVIGLSVGQLVYVTGTTLQHVCQLTSRDPSGSLWYWVVSLYGGIYCGIVARRGTYVVMSLVSLERLYAIVRPLHVKGFLLSRHPLLSMMSAYVISAILHVYILTKTEIRGMSTGRQNTTIYRPVPTQLYLSHKAVNDAFSMGVKILLTYCGLLTQLSLNLLTIYFLQRHNAATQRVTSTAKEETMRQRERQLTVTMLAATLCYILLSLPSALHHLVYTIHPEYNGLSGPYRDVYILVQDLTLLLSVLSCGVDFVCFMVLSSNYRATLLAVCGLKKKKGTREAAERSGLSTQLQTVG